MLPSEWDVSAVERVRRRRAAGKCTRCGEHSPVANLETCRGCHAKKYASEKARRQLRQDEHRRQVTAQAERSRRSRREVTIDGVTFLVMNG